MRIEEAVADALSAYQIDIVEKNQRRYRAMGIENPLAVILDVKKDYEMTNDDNGHPVDLLRGIVEAKANEGVNSPQGPVFRPMMIELWAEVQKNLRDAGITDPEVDAELNLETAKDSSFKKRVGGKSSGRSRRAK